MGGSLHHGNRRPGSKRHLGRRPLFPWVERKNAQVREAMDMKRNKTVKLRGAQTGTARFGLGMLMPTMILLLVMTAYPLIFTLLYSFTDYNYLRGAENASFVLVPLKSQNAFQVLKQSRRCANTRKNTRVIVQHTSSSIRTVTVGPGVPPGQRMCCHIRSRTLPPVGSFTPP